jgi:hypothetical protein
VLAGSDVVDTVVLRCAQPISDKAATTAAVRLKVLLCLLMV